MTNFVEQAKSYNPDLYSSVDLSQLNWLEQQWVAWYSYWGNPIIATGIMSFVMHEVSSPLLCLMWQPRKNLRVERSH